jgi:hypothetical protein
MTVAGASDAGQCEVAFDGEVDAVDLGVDGRAESISFSKSALEGRKPE